MTNKKPSLIEAAEKVCEQWTEPLSVFYTRPLYGAIAHAKEREALVEAVVLAVRYYRNAMRCREEAPDLFTADDVFGGLYAVDAALTALDRFDAGEGK